MQLTQNSNKNYYQLKNNQLTWSDRFLYILQTPFLLVYWIIAFIVAQIVTRLALNPAGTWRQRQIHAQKDDDIVVVNLIPHPPYKLFLDFFVKIRSMLADWLPISTERTRLSLQNPKDKAYIDKLIEDIEKLFSGTCDAKHCKGVIFGWEQIHFKGLEYLDTELQNYFFNKLTYEQLHNQTLNFFSLETLDNAVLDSVEILPDLEENAKPMDQRKFVIYCNFRDLNYISQLGQLRTTAKEVGCTVIGFNYRGVCHSKGMVWTQQNTVDDVLAQVHRLELLGANPENICIEGHCLGGAIATLATAQLHRQDKRVKLFNDRSFQTLPRFIAGYILPDGKQNLWDIVTLGRYVAGALAYAFMAVILWPVRWDMDAAAAWELIPKDYKDYMVAHENSSSDVGDGVVHSWASIGKFIGLTPEHEFQSKPDEKATPAHFKQPDKLVQMKGQKTGLQYKLEAEKRMLGLFSPATGGTTNKDLDANPFFSSQPTCMEI